MNNVYRCLQSEYSYIFCELQNKMFRKVLIKHTIMLDKEYTKDR